MTKIEQLVNKYKPEETKVNKVALNTFLKEGIAPAKKTAPATNKPSANDKKQSTTEQASGAQQSFEFGIDDDNDVQVINKPHVHQEAVSDDEDESHEAETKIAQKDKDPIEQQSEILKTEQELGVVAHE